MRRALAGGVAALALACSGSYDVDAVDEVLSAVEGSDPLFAKNVLVAGLLESDVASSSCTEAWDGLVSVDPAQKSAIVWGGLDGMMPACPTACPADVMQSLSIASPAERMQIVADSCEPATMFADSRLDGLRSRFDVLDWLVVQALTEPIMQRGGPQADRLTALAPTIAVGMVERPFVDLDQIPNDSFAVIETAEAEEMDPLLEPQRRALQACLGDERTGNFRIVLDVDGRLARVMSDGDETCFLDAVSGIAWPSGAAAVIDVVLGK